MIRIGFTGAGLDRMDLVRLDPQRIAAAAAHPGARLLALNGLDPVLDAGGRLTWHAINGAEQDRLIFLGAEPGGAPHFAPLVDDLPIGQRAWCVFGLLAQMDGADAAIWGTARSLIEWHARHLFCGHCGSATEAFRAGWGRRCPACGLDHFPRVDPVVIMLAQHGGRVLVGRQHQYPPGRYSALAGFVEPGESIEEAVARELQEEAGVEASTVRYVASQPWPFPGSLMIGCIAEVASDRLTLDTTEIEDAMWVDSSQVRAALAGAANAPFQAPPPFAIAHSLLAIWADAA